jgi:transposase
MRRCATKGTQTFVAGLRHDRLVAPWLLDGPMNRAAFDVRVETQLAPELGKGDVVILDNLPVHRSPRAAEILRERGAWLLFLQRYSPELNPIETAFSKLNAHQRRIGARTLDALWRAVGEICDLFDPDECWNYFKEARYVSDQTHEALNSENSLFPAKLNLASRWRRPRHWCGRNGRRSPL